MLYDKRAVLVRAPVRVSFVGGGTDFPEFCNGGRNGHVVSSAVDLYCYAQLKDMFDANVRVHHARIETESVVSRIKHPYARTALESHGLFRGVEVVLTSDIMTTGSGLGASSSTMGVLIAACRAFRQEVPLEAKAMARRICELEAEAGTVSGLQDQYAVAYGGLNSITFSADGVDVQRLAIPRETREELSRRLVLVYTNLARREDEIQVEHRARIDEENRTDYLEGILSLSYEFRDELLRPVPDLDKLGDMLHEGWVRKREFNPKVTNPYIDQLYQQLREIGVIGGKLLGAGGGGFILALTREGTKDALKYELYPNFIGTDISFVDTGIETVWRSWET